MKSFFRICVVLSTVLVLGTTQPLEEERREWRSQENLPVRQYYQPGSDATYQNVHQYPIAIDSFAPIKPNKDPHNGHRLSHAHRIRQISMLEDVNKHGGTRVIRLPPNGNPKDLRVMLINEKNRTVYEDNNVPDSVKEILAKALAVNRGEAEIVHNETPVNEIVPQRNTQPDNSQSVKVKTVHLSTAPSLGKPRPRNRVPGPKGPPHPAIPGYRRRRPFRYPNIRRTPGRPYKIVPQETPKAIANNTKAVLNDGVIPENGIKTVVTIVKPVDGNEKAKIKTTVEEVEFISTDGQKVVSDSIKETTLINDKSQIVVQTTDKIEPTTPVPADKDIAAKTYKPVAKLEKPDVSESPAILPAAKPKQALDLPVPAVDKLVSAPKTLTQPLLEDVPMNPKVADTIATSTSVPIKENDNSPKILLNKANVLTSIITLPKSILPGAILKIPKTEDKTSKIISKTTESPINHPKDKDEVSIDASTITSTTVTEPTKTPTIANEEDDFFATELLESLFTLDDSTTTTHAPSTTVKPLLLANPKNNVDVPTLKLNKFDTATVDSVTETAPANTENGSTDYPPATETSDTDNYDGDDDDSDVSTTTETTTAANTETTTVVASTTQGLKPKAPVKQTVSTKEALKTKDLPTKFHIGIDDFDEVVKNKHPYVVIRGLPHEENTTTEPSLFTTLVDYIIGYKEMKHAKTDAKEHKPVSDLEIKEKLGPSATDLDKETKPKIAEKESKTEEQVKRNDIIDTEDEEVITSADVDVLPEDGPMTPISFVVNIVRSALKGADSLKALFSDQKVKDFILGIFNIK